MRDVVCVSSSPEQTREIASTLASGLAGGDVVVLAGDLGAGKTTFVQGAAAALGVRAHVTSPSFVLVREYAGRARVVHVDVYRLTSLQEVIDLGYEELFAPDAITFVEWGDAVDAVLPDERLEVDIRVVSEEERRIVIRGFGEAARARLGEMSFARWAVPV
ncbi:MAG TPA: tRNA (adenosine(37)-N6)-threonylcarbamoyltransferase complex ATPase subunit type 1 TsaE [Actinomycetota bacterium]|nr:tRNA (adenosine(37)-N6)-threonylcarbamoyltransferase complex ATPase subunit type 1 TsaE [Actinomycetota bacterium]